MRINTCQLMCSLSPLLSRSLRLHVRQLRFVPSFGLGNWYLISLIGIGMGDMSTTQSQHSGPQQFPPGSITKTIISEALAEFLYPTGDPSLYGLNPLSEGFLQAARSFWTDFQSHGYTYTTTRNERCDATVIVQTHLERICDHLSWPSTIPAFVKPVEEYTLFLFTELYPYLKDHHVPLEVGAVVAHYLTLPTREWYIPLEARWEKGMLRDRLIRLICKVLKSVMRALRRLMSEVAGDYAMKAAIVHFGSTWLRFLSSDRFRSERLEILILKYLDEDGVDLRVVGGVVTETMKRVEAGDDLFRSLAP
ncbi:hypothetical protein BJ508DRAFT_20112 [Ascobolus immersus RN42]|uniref:Uncharacterized protein n=1 Tax=Ascobolus immersus RN42 TaxID=1160509 RepID=A0A3N4IFI9_ASCIM|nr:hypothetical protein BJ508DRAFT_20112 [Ascobolus immersus RN42]